MTIALDAHGGDKGVPVCVPAGLSMLAERDDLHVIFVGQREVIDPYLQKAGSAAARVTVHDARQIVAME